MNFTLLAALVLSLPIRWQQLGSLDPIPIREIPNIAAACLAAIVIVVDACANNTVAIFIKIAIPPEVVLVGEVIGDDQIALSPRLAVALKDKDATAPIVVATCVDKWSPNNSTITFNGATKAKLIARINNVAHERSLHDPLANIVSNIHPRSAGFEICHSRPDDDRITICVQGP